MMTTSPVSQEVPLSLRNRQPINASCPSDSITVANNFKVVSYNILAACHTKPSYYPYRDPEILEQDFRHTVLMTELKWMDADVYCMQEVGSIYYTEKLEPEMRNMGYSGLFVKRTITSYKEGCATFFRISKFTLVDSRVFPLDNLAEEAIDAIGITNENFKSRYTRGRGSVLQMTSLKCLSSECVITFANIHLVWQGTEIPDVRCMHAACCMKAIGQYHHPEACGVVFCGDFNSEPHTTTYAMVTAGGDFGKAIEEIKPFLDEYWMSNFQMVIDLLKQDIPIFNSTYKVIMGTEPPVTNMDGEFNICLDYIFYGNKTSSNMCSVKMVPLQVLDLLSEDEMRQSLPPSSVFPSDHLPLVATFTLVKDRL